MPDQPSPRVADFRARLAFVIPLLAATACFVGSLTTISRLGTGQTAHKVWVSVLMIAFSLGAYALLQVAIHAEHRLRALSVPAPAPSPAVPAPAPVVKRPPKNGPLARAIGLLLVLGFVGVLIAIIVSVHSRAARSAETQDHGISRDATILTVHSESHATKGGSWTTYNYDVQLSAPVGTATTTVLNDPSRDFQQFDPGDTTTVLVDPKDLTYAELPGHAVQGKDWVWIPVIMGAVALIFVVSLTSAMRKQRKIKAAAAMVPEGATLN